MKALRKSAICLIGLPCAFATACRSGRPGAADQVAGFRQLLRLADPAPAAAVCLGLAQGDRVRDAPPRVLAALRTERPTLRPLSACAGGNGMEPGAVRLLLTRAKTTGDTLLVEGANGALTYKCRVSRSGAWAGNCVLTRAV
jgi:hypothetical protein